MLHRIDGGTLFQAGITTKGNERRRLLPAVVGSGSVSCRPSLEKEEMATWSQVACTTRNGA